MGKHIITTAMIAVLLSSCSLTHKLNKDAHTADLSLPKPMVDAPVKDTSSYVSNITELRDTSNQFLLDAQTDSDGDKIALIDIESISVVTTTKTVAERMGEISIDFMISIPISLQNKNWAVSFTPVLNMGNDISDLDKIIIRGEIFNDLQKRQYWQFNKYLNRITGSEAFAINSNALIAQYYEARELLPERKRASIEKVYRETIKYPYANDSRLDSVLLQKGQLNYYYTQVIKTNERTGNMKLHFEGNVSAIDNSSFKLPPSDTLDYIVTSMISLVDNTPQYLTKIVEKYAVINDKYMLVFPVGQTRIVDTMANNRVEVEKIEILLNSLLHQYEYHLDSIIITATGSPDGSYHHNEALAKNRAQSLKNYLSKKLRSNIDTLITIRWKAEDWDELQRLVLADQVLTNKKALLDLIASVKNPDEKETKIRSSLPKEYKYIKDKIYPRLRTVNFRYNLRRVGMIQDTVHTTILDTTYLKGVEYLKARHYVNALSILEPYKNYNTAIVMLSLGYDQVAYEILKGLKDRPARTEYLYAIACARIGKLEDGLRHYNLACELDPILKFRSNLDPEIQILIKQMRKNNTI